MFMLYPSREELLKIYSLYWRGLPVATRSDISPADMPELKSGTHLQILSVLARELEGVSPQPGQTLNVLDVGCGDGLLIAYLTEALPKLFPGVDFALYGFDVGDHGVQTDGYFDETISLLSQTFPDTRWSDRLALISERDAWPYADGFFAATVSNQVLEHVRDHDMFFAETARVTQTNGVSVHVFPSRHTWIEQHTLVPFAHRFGQAHRIEAAIRFWSRRGRGRYPEHKRMYPAVTPESYAERHADYLIRYTNFQPKRLFLATAKAHQLHASFRHSGLYIWEKLRRMRGKSPRYTAPAVPTFWQRALSLLAPYVTNVTLVTVKSRAYDTPPAEKAG